MNELTILQLGMMVQQSLNFLGEYDDDIDWDILIANPLKMDLSPL